MAASLTQFIASEQRRNTIVQRWFNARPALVRELADALLGEHPVTISAMIRYIRKDHDCRLSEASIRRFIDSLV